MKRSLFSRLRSFRFLPACPALLAFSCALSSPPEGEGKIDAALLPRAGVKVLEAFSGKPRGEGVLASFDLVLPPFRRAVFFSGDGRRWPADSNRVLPWISGPDLGALFAKGYVQNPTVKKPERRGLFLLLRLETGETLALLPLAGPETMSWLQVEKDGKLRLLLGTLGEAPVSCDAPLLAWGRDRSPYRACRLAWKRALEAPPIRGRVRPRWAKTFPEPFRYLGWCSWEQYKKRIDEKVLLSAARGIERSGIPVRWILVDDGHETRKKRMLVSFEPDRKKFPRGWAPLLAMRKPGKIRWMGLWHAFQGYWGNLAPENRFGPLNRFLAPIARGKRTSLLPKDDPAAARAFYGALVGSAADYGFDFLKVDVQSWNLREYMGTANAVRAASQNAQALEEAVHARMKGMINCMAHNTVCLFNTKYSAVTRCSIDYKLGAVKRGKSHLMQSFHDTLWLGWTAWPDHDMFHSSDPACGRMMAVSKALSGGPVYLSDPPGRFVKEFILPLCLSTGRLLRPLAPAVPLPDSLFLDALNRRRPYRVIAPLPFGAAAVAVYDLDLRPPAAPLRASVTPGDYRWAGALAPPGRAGGTRAVPPEGLVVYDWYARRGSRLEGAYTFELKGFSDRLLLLCPVREGWAVVGNPEKYLSPATLREAAFGPRSLTVTLLEPGPVVIWSGSGKPSAERGTLLDLGGGFYRAEPAGSPGRTWTFRR